MTKEEIKAFKPIINSMKLIREYCETRSGCTDCAISGDGVFDCPLDVPATWNCEQAIAALEAEEAEDE